MIKNKSIETLTAKSNEATDNDVKQTPYEDLINNPEAKLEDYLKFAIFLRDVDLSKSLTILDEAQNKFGESAWIEDNRARAFVSLNSLEMAAESWEKAIVLANENEKAFFITEVERPYQTINNKINQEITKAKLEKNWSQVISSLNKYLLKQPNNLFIYLELAIAYRNQRDYKNSLATLKLAEEKYPDSAWIYDNYARVYLARKLYKNAIKQSEIAIDLSKSAEDRSLFRQLLETAKKEQKSNTDPNIKAVEIIHDSGLFDEQFYIQRNVDINPELVDVLEHFVLFGWKEGREPNHYFSLSWYAKRYNLGNGANPLLHYIENGWQQLFDTSPHFCTAKYFETYKNEIKQYHDPLAYFINAGRQLGHKPFEVAFSAGIVKLAKRNSKLPVPDDLTLYAAFDKKADYSGSSQLFNPKKLNIHWIIPDFSPGSGGHMTIFRMINHLERFGHTNTIWITGKHFNKTTDAAYETIVKHFQFVSANVKFFSSAFYAEQADAVIATGWNTVWGALGNSKIKRAFYFVQDFEPSFYAAGTRAIVAEETYKQDIDCICASPWLAQIMSERYQRWATSFLLSYDAKSYYPAIESKVNSGKIEIAAYYRPFTDRRAVELVLMGLEQLAKQLPNFRVHFFGNHQPLTFDAPFEYIDQGVLSATELGDLYRACDVGLTFSATNYSLIPQEMMACGLPVVELDTECCRTVFPEHTITLAKPHPLSIAENIIRVLEDKEQSSKQVAAAQDWIKQFTWETAARTVESAIVERLSHFGFNSEAQSSLGTEKPEVSVVIPTYNAGELFKTVLAQVLAQKTAWKFEVIVIDSSSADGTAEFLQSQTGIVLHSIPKSEFQHGKTRNLGAQMAQGDYIAFMTQDALPTSEYWLSDLIASLKKYPKAAGVFGKHLPWDNASPFVKRDLKNHFKTFDNQPLCVSRFLNEEKYLQGDQGWQQFLRFYSDNNSAMRKDVWQQIPYPNINFGEDQAWAQTIIEAGYEKVYSPYATVYHSHDYEYKEQFVRAYEEYTFFKEEFGLLCTVNTENLTNEIEALNHRDTVYANNYDIAISEEQLQKQFLLNKGFVLGKHAVYISDSYGNLEDKRKLLEEMLED